LTPLHVAAHCGNVRIAKLLLDSKCQVSPCALVRPTTSTHSLCAFLRQNKVSPPRRRDDMSPADFSSTAAYRFAANQAIMDPKIAVDLRTSLVAGGG